MLSSEYGWGTQYILGRTLYEINWRINFISKRINSNKRFEMSIHGATEKSDTSETETPRNKLSDDQKKAMDIALERAKERKRLEFLNKQ